MKRYLMALLLPITGAILPMASAQENGTQVHWAAFGRVRQMWGSVQPSATHADNLYLRSKQCLLCEMISCAV
jgi:hypothetical protein